MEDTRSLFRVEVDFNSDRPREWCKLSFSIPCPTEYINIIVVSKVSKLIYSFVSIYAFSHYQVLVHRVKDWTDTISDWSNLGPDFYISAQIPASAVNPSMTFVLGDGEDIGGFTNKKLSRGQKYKIYSRAITDKSKVYKQRFNYQRERWVCQQAAVIW